MTASAAIRATLLSVTALALVACSSVTGTAAPGVSSGPSPASSAPGATAPSPASATTSPSEAGEPAALVLACVSVTDAECRFLARQIVAALPQERGPAFAVQIQLFRCENEAAPCPPTLDARRGKAIVEFLDGDAPMDLSLQGPAAAPRIAPQDAFYLGSTNPSSLRVNGPGPFPFEMGHCGVSHVIDFDGSFWIPTGQVDGDHPTMINAESGSMRLLGPDLAEFRSDSGFTVQLARFPGPKHFWGCD